MLKPYHHFVTVAIALGIFLAGTGLLAPTSRAATTTVHIQGQVTSAELGMTLVVEAQASGGPKSLSGIGMDTPIGIGSGECTIPLAGSIKNGVIKLSGVVTQSSDPSNLGAPVTFTADAASGSIKFNFAGFIFTGTGMVLIEN